MVSRELLKKLRAKKKKLDRLVDRQRRVKRANLRVKTEAKRLKKEIKALKRETSKSFVSRLRRAKDDPTLKSRLMRGKREASRFFKGLQRIADNLPKDE